MTHPQIALHIVFLGMKHTSNRVGKYVTHFGWEATQNPNKGVLPVFLRVHTGPTTTSCASTAFDLLGLLCHDDDGAGEKHGDHQGQHQASSPPLRRVGRLYLTSTMRAQARQPPPV